MNMDTEDYIDMLSVRAADMRAMALFFAIIHTGLLVVLGFAGSGLEVGNSTRVDRSDRPHVLMDGVLYGRLHARPVCDISRPA